MESAILNDKEIKELCLTKEMIDPFVDNNIRQNKEGNKIISSCRRFSTSTKCFAKRRIKDEKALCRNE